MIADNISTDGFNPPLLLATRKNPMKSRLPRGIQDTYLVTAILVVLLAVYWWLQPKAFGVWPIAGLMAAIAPLALAAAGEAVVVINRGFDLSLAGVISIVNVIAVTLPFDGISGALLLLVVSMAVGAAVGYINGVLVTYLKLQSLAATLAVMIILGGIAFSILEAPGGSVNDWVVDNLTGNIFTVPQALLVLLVVWFGWVRLRRSAFGVNLYAIGADERAAQLSGINVRRTRIYAYVVAGIFYSFAGIMLSAQTGTGSPIAGDPLLLMSFAAVVLGGVSLFGGIGSIFSAMVGAAILVVLIKVLFVIGISSFYTAIVQGVVIIVVVAANSIMGRRKKEE